AYGVALRLLETRDRFEAEIARALAAKGYADQTPDVLERLRKQGIANDRRVAEAIIMGREGRRAIGDELLRHRLLEKGAPEALVDDLLGGRDEAESAYQALVGKFGPEAPRAKAGRFLASRGFGEEAIESALERLASSSE
ncbi:MAG TPA: RecX family transcriptional regulator, partial [Fimbriimonas sp.]